MRTYDIRQDQVVTPKIFDKIVRDEIERCFKIRYLTDERFPGLYREVSERELKDEVYSIFFKSLDDILESIGIEIPSGQCHNRFTGRNEKLKIRLYWYDRSHIIHSYDIAKINFPDMNRDGEYSDLNYKIVRNIFPNVEIEEDGDGDMILKFRMIYLYFYYKGKKYVIENRRQNRDNNKLYLYQELL